MIRIRGVTWLRFFSFNVFLWNTVWENVDSKNEKFERRKNDLICTAQKLNMNAKEQLLQWPRASFFLFQSLHSRGSFDMLVMFPASTERCKVDSCCQTFCESLTLWVFVFKYQRTRWFPIPTCALVGQDLPFLHHVTKQLWNLIWMVGPMAYCGWQPLQTMEKNGIQIQTLYNLQPRSCLKELKHLHEWTPIWLHCCPNSGPPIFPKNEFWPSSYCNHPGTNFQVIYWVVEFAKNSLSKVSGM